MPCTTGFLSVLGQGQQWGQQVRESASASILFAFTLPSVILSTTDLSAFPGGTSGKESVCQCRRHKRPLVQSLGQENPLEKEMATHSSVPAWKNPMDRGAWQATVHEVVKSWTRLTD